ncbi:hypothetical protein OH76DRAFT_1426454 [Lentinus brumalis]|uniref:rRNA-processing protein FYV7 n=1 Tax=Lentinus brumalis TaxID=2498619 RepID=A0A371DVZ7_9APHY|nr:hypothetical protein OH76DRAFT_1426454 [Polyporus brumalis]
MSPSSSTQQPQGVKRKKPPTFQHLPAERAKKLKQSWVETQKIKSKWKAQKRKEGLVAPRTHLDLVAGADEEKDTRGSGEESDKEAEETSTSGSSDQIEEQPPSLRDLQRMAYSRSSLHTHKSDPLHRHRGGVMPNGRGGGGRDEGRGGPRGRGRGQPDMGLRMKAMLEKIKQDYA